MSHCILDKEHLSSPVAVYSQQMSSGKKENDQGQRRKMIPIEGSISFKIANERSCPVWTELKVVLVINTKNKMSILVIQKEGNMSMPCYDCDQTKRQQY